MESSAVLDIAKEAIFLLLKTSLPIMLVAMVVGVLISLVQALTQIQEVTLSFVPKIIAIFVSIILFLPFISNAFMSFSVTIINMIQKI